MWHKCLVWVCEISVAHQCLSERKEKIARRQSSQDVSGSISLIITPSLAPFITVRSSSLCFSSSSDNSIDLRPGITLHSSRLWMSGHRYAYAYPFVTAQHTFVCSAAVLAEMQRMVWFVIKRHLLCEAVSFSLSSVISALLIIWPRAASAQIQPKTLMEHNEPHSFPAAYQIPSRESGATVSQCRNPWQSTTIEEEKDVADVNYVSLLLNCDDDVPASLCNNRQPFLNHS